MKRFLVVILGLVVVLSVNLTAFAAEGGEGENQIETVVPDVTIINEIYTEEATVSAETSVMSLSPVTSSDATGFKAVLLSVIGDWDSIVVEHAYTTTSGNTSYVREIQLDYPWLCSCGLFALVIYCLFRLGGAVLCRK